jgi:hypothetical protein
MPGPDTPKQAACLACRKSKIRCDRSPGGDVCKRCTQVGVECEIPEFHVGRQRGVKNKRSGLEKGDLFRFCARSKSHF